MEQFKIFFSVALMASMAFAMMSFIGTSNNADSKSTLHAQLITYQLEGISLENYQNQKVDPDGPVLTEVDGLVSKVWLADDEKMSYDGFMFGKVKSI